jgi:Adenosine deaminase
VLHELDDDLMELLRRLAVRPEGVDDPVAYSRFPAQALRASTPQEAGTLPYDVADGHLHSGASLHVASLLRALAEASTPPVFAARGVRITPVPCPDAVPTAHLILALRWATRYLWEIAEGLDENDYDAFDGAGLGAADAASVRDGGYWRHFSDPDQWRREHPSVIATFPERGNSAEIASYLDYYLSRSGSLADHRRAFVAGFAWATWRLGSEVASVHGEGLSRFVDRFDTMGSIRDAALSHIRRTQVSESLRAAAPTRDVVGAEFRKSIAKATRADAAAEIRASVEEHLDGFTEFLDRTGRSLALTMPVTFVRRLRLGVHQAAGLTELRHAIECAYGLSQFLDNYPQLSGFIHAVDVVGPENGSQNWPYAVAMDILGTHDIVRCVHAGESFAHRLTGLRKVAEWFAYDVPRPHRIGHGLALDADASDAVVRSAVSPPMLVDALLDLAWAAGTSAVPENEAIQLIQVLATQASTQFGAVSAVDWVEGARMLRTIEGLKQSNVISKDADGWRVMPDDLVSEMRGLLSGSALAANLLACEFGEPRRVFLTQDHAEQFLAFEARYVDELREEVSDDVRQGGATIESCPTSNLILAGIRSYSLHPMWAFVRSGGFGVTVSTDDPIVFGTSIVDEFRRLHAHDLHQVLPHIAKHSVDLCSRGKRRTLRDITELRKVLSDEAPAA